MSKARVWGDVKELKIFSGLFSLPRRALDALLNTHGDARVCVFICSNGDVLVQSSKLEEPMERAVTKS